MRSAQLSLDDRGDRGLRADALDRTAPRRRLQNSRRARRGRLQVRPLARLGADAAPARQGLVRAALNQTAASFSGLSTARSTPSSSWPRFTINPVAEITLYAPWRRASLGFFSIR